jgi:hypothetical protein
MWVLKVFLKKYDSSRISNGYYTATQKGYYRTGTIERG